MVMPPQDIAAKLAQQRQQALARIATARLIGLAAENPPLCDQIAWTKPQQENAQECHKQPNLTTQSAADAA
jgi:predicted house-cleaning NTP pyrophosphatase (Maf/HAM1 superfamily)